MVVMNPQGFTNKKEAEIRKLENERRAVIYEMELALRDRVGFLEGCRQTLLTIQTDSDQQGKIEQRVMETEARINEEVDRMKESYGPRIRSLQTKLMTLYLGSFMDEKE